MLSHGDYFEDFEVGQEWQTPARTITEADVVAFAGLSGDYNPLHTDEVYASAGMHGRRIAHGLLGMAVFSGLVMRLGILEESVMLFRELTCKFRAPIFIGDTVHGRMRVAETKAIARLGGGLVRFKTELYNQQDQVLQSGQWAVLVRSRDASTQAS